MARRRHLRPRVVVIPNGAHVLRRRHGVGEPTSSQSKSTAAAIAHPTAAALPKSTAAALAKSTTAALAPFPAAKAAATNILCRRVCYEPSPDGRHYNLCHGVHKLRMRLGFGVDI